VYFFSGEDEWGWYVLDVVKRALPLIESLSGFPFPFEFDILTWERTPEQLQMDCELKEVGRPCNRLEEGIFLPEGITDGAILHELGHFWFSGEIFKDSWMMEGMVEYITVSTLYLMGEDLKGKSYRKNLIQIFLNHWGDFPLYGWDPREEDFSYGYAKAFTFFYILDRELGTKTLLEGNSFMHERSQREKRLFDARDYKVILKYFTEKNVGELFSGWIFEGKYYHRGEAVGRYWFFSDDDSDGIFNFEESFYRTDSLNFDSDEDSISDGFELILGTDPALSDSDGDGLEDGEEMIFKIDGRREDWKNFEPISQDPLGDVTYKELSQGDLRGLYFASDEIFLYFMIDYQEMPNKNVSGIALDLNLDSISDFRVYLNQKDEIWIAKFENGKLLEETNTGKDIRSIAIFRYDVVEFRIPKFLSVFSFPEEFQIQAFDYTPELDLTYWNDWTQWVKVEREENFSPGTDPLNPDTDDDGILDGEDPFPLGGKPESPTSEAKKESQKSLGAPPLLLSLLFFPFFLKILRKLFPHP
ncbi:MAG: hypothetical protein ACE5HW_02100, partial [Candidatus Methanofastidiosia archaeon]